MQKSRDELLVAYLDGELDERRRAEVETLLQRDETARLRLTQLGEGATLLRAAFDEVLREEVPERLIAAARGTTESEPTQGAEILHFRRKRTAESWRTYKRWWIAVPVAASLFGIMVGGGLTYVGVDHQTPPTGAMQQAAASAAATNNWLDTAAEYHKLFVTASTGGGSFADIPAKDGENSGDVMQKLSQRIAQPPMRVPNLKPWGLVFQGARAIVIEQHPAAQLFYTADNKTIGKAIGPLTVVIASSNRPDVAPTFDHRQDLNLLYWRRKGHAYAIVGQADIGYMWGLANDIAWQFDAI
ncbi:MAG TPA: hypothetical protein VFA50_12440 [Stellaceae bacterium]|nr:hypothetical protein [Stellaceae bacterium]